MRDDENYHALESAGWKVLVIWECELKKKVAEENLQNLYKRVIFIK